MCLWEVRVACDSHPLMLTATFIFPDNHQGYTDKWGKHVFTSIVRKDCGQQMLKSHSIPSDALKSRFASTCSLRSELEVQVQVYENKATLQHWQGAWCTLYSNKYVTQENVNYKLKNIQKPIWILSFQVLFDWCALPPCLCVCLLHGGSQIWWIGG